MALTLIPAQLGTELLLQSLTHLLHCSIDRSVCHRALSILQ